jgi:hypothetical protein
MTALLGLSSLSIVYVLVVLLHTLIIKVLSSCYMHLMIMYGNITLHREYSPGIIFIFSQGRKDLYHV